MPLHRAQPRQAVLQRDQAVSAYRYDKLADNYLAFFKLAICACALLNAYVRRKPVVIEYRCSLNLLETLDVHP